MFALLKRNLSSLFVVSMMVYCIILDINGPVMFPVIYTLVISVEIATVWLREEKDEDSPIPPKQTLSD